MEISLPLLATVYWLYQKPKTKNSVKEQVQKKSNVLPFISARKSN